MTQISKNLTPSFFIIILSLAFVEAHSQQDSLMVIDLITKSTEQLQAGKKKEALIKADSALLLAKGLGLDKFIVSAHHSKAACLDALKKPKLAIAEYTAALELAKNNGSSPLQMKALEGIYAYYFNKRKYPEAFNYRNELATLRDSVFKDEIKHWSAANDSLINVLEIERNRNDAKIASITEDSKESIDKSSLYIGILMGCLVLTFLGFIILIKLHRAKIKNGEDELALANKKISDLHLITVKERNFLQAYETNNLQLEYNFYQEVFEKFSSVKTQLEQFAKVAGSAFPVDKYLGLQNIVSKLARDLKAKSSNVAPEVFVEKGLCESLKLAFASAEQTGDRIVFSSICQHWSRGFIDDVLIFRLVTGIVGTIKSENGLFNGSVDLNFLADDLEIVIKSSERAYIGDLANHAYSHFRQYLQAEIAINTDNGNLIDIRIIVSNISN